MEPKKKLLRLLYQRSPLKPPKVPGMSQVNTDQFIFSKSPEEALPAPAPVPGYQMKSNGKAKPHKNSLGKTLS